MSDFVLMLLVGLGVVLPPAITLVAAAKKRIMLGIIAYVGTVSYMAGTWGLLYQEHPEWWVESSGLVIAPVLCGIIMAIIGGLFLLFSDEVPMS